MQFAIALLLGLFCSFLFLCRLGERELSSSHEARAAQDAQTMLDTGDWTVPRLFDGQIELQKPPLYYWLVALFAWTNGGSVDAWTVRLPAALAALLTVLLVYLLGVRRGRPLAGFLAALFLATFLHFTWLARVGRIDMPLTLTVTLAITGFSEGAALRGQERRGAWRWLLLGYLALAFGLLLKGPIAAVLPAVVAALYLLLSRTGAADAPDDPAGTKPMHWVRAYGLWWGLPLVLLLVGPWYLYANHCTNGEFCRVFFGHHNLARGLLGDETLKAYPVWFYLPRVIVDLLPWSILLPAAMWWAIRGGVWRRERAVRLGLAWLGGIALFLSLMRFKRADYLLPAYPGAALLLGCAAAQWWRQGRLRKLMPVTLAAVVAGLLLLWSGYLERTAREEDDAPSYRQFAHEIRRRTSNPVIFFRTEAHPLAFHVGRPLYTVLEWENLDVWVGRDRATYVVMTAEGAAQWQRHISSGQLAEVLRLEGAPKQHQTGPLVLLRTVPHPATGPRAQVIE